jgi:hypothetical protein
MPSIFVSIFPQLSTQLSKTKTTKLERFIAQLYKLINIISFLFFKKKEALYCKTNGWSPILDNWRGWEEIMGGATTAHTAWPKAVRGCFSWRVSEMLNKLAAPGACADAYPLWRCNAMCKHRMIFNYSWPISQVLENLYYYERGSIDNGLFWQDF